MANGLTGSKGNDQRINRDKGNVGQGANLGLGLSVRFICRSQDHARPSGVKPGPAQQDRQNQPDHERFFRFLLRCRILRFINVSQGNARFSRIVVENENRSKVTNRLLIRVKQSCSSGQKSETR